MTASPYAKLRLRKAAGWAPIGTVIWATAAFWILAAVHRYGKKPQRSFQWLIEKIESLRFLEAQIFEHLPALIDHCLAGISIGLYGFLIVAVTHDFEQSARTGSEKAVDRILIRHAIWIARIVGVMMAVFVYRFSTEMVNWSPMDYWLGIGGASLIITSVTFWHQSLAWSKRHPGAAVLACGAYWWLQMCVSREWRQHVHRAPTADQSIYQLVASMSGFLLVVLVTQPILAWHLHRSQRWSEAASAMARRAATAQGVSKVLH
ncbi:hypothetical protein [Cupriavidus campinensis]|uniref:hypothetical protein n=1 Tax=Cupriavidus campinensis TaxID=151783 RepID=UPI0011EEDE6C|nr:hypothetical protein [Cupriavidus campinensis]